MITKTYPVGTLPAYKYVVVLSEYQGKILLSRHKKRTTWETQGGKIELGETPLMAAKRELYEESGAVDFKIEPLCDYWAGEVQTKEEGNGRVFLAKVKKLSAMPESEMAEVRTFDELPEKLTYPAITPTLFERKKTGHRETSALRHWKSCKIKSDAEKFRTAADRDRWVIGY